MATLVDLERNFEEQETTELPAKELIEEQPP
jgi:hypothetical protein